ncbi:MAG: MBL fold metallo-hydrolase [Actinomycetota bacterium]
MPTPSTRPLAPADAWTDDQVRLTETVSVLVGPDNGSYPSGNSMLIEGGAETALIDPSVTVVAKGGAPVAVDAVINSHGHEDHVAGNGLYAGSRVHIHHDDLEAARTLDGLLAVYGFEGEARADFEQLVLEEFHYTERPDAQGFGDGHVFDLGGGVRLEAVHLPGHTRGHSGFVTDDVCFLSDIDLTGFGPYYGDAWSDLEQFEASLAIAREIEARWYVTFHHKGIIDGRETFLEMIDAFTAVIDRRHQAMLAFLAEPRSLVDLAKHRFVYRPHVEGHHIEAVEARTAELHVARMLQRGEITEVAPGCYQRA